MAITSYMVASVAGVWVFTHYLMGLVDRFDRYRSSNNLSSKRLQGRMCLGTIYLQQCFSGCNVRKRITKMLLYITPTQSQCWLTLYHRYNQV